MTDTKSWKVYMHVSKIDGKAYCGITCKSLRTRFGTNGSGYVHCTRFYEAIQRDGWDSFEHMLIMPDGSKEEAESLEQAIIKCCHLTDYERGYNTYDGSVDGIPISESARTHLHMFFGLQKFFSSQAIIVYDNSGRHINTFESGADCAKHFKCKAHCIFDHAVKNGSCLKNGCYVRRADEYNGIEQLPADELIAYRSHISTRRMINQYSLDGKYIRTYNSVTEAGNLSGVSRNSISHNLIKCKGGKAGGYQWRYHNGSTDDIEPYVKGKSAPHVTRHSPVCKIDPATNQVVKEYFSIELAATDNNVSTSAIKQALKGKIKTCRGCKWIYKNQLVMPGEG